MSTTLKKRDIATKMTQQRLTSNVFDILNMRLGTISDEYQIAELERIHLGNQIYALRTGAGLSYSALARKVGVKAADIERLENSDYEEYPFPLIRKVAAALGTKVEIKFVPAKKKYHVEK